MYIQMIQMKMIQMNMYDIFDNIKNPFDDATPAVETWDNLEDIPF